MDGNTRRTRGSSDLPGSLDGDRWVCLRGGGDCSPRRGEGQPGCQQGDGGRSRPPGRPRRLPGPQLPGGVRTFSGARACRVAKGWGWGGGEGRLAGSRGPGAWELGHSGRPPGAGPRRRRGGSGARAGPGPGERTGREASGPRARPGAPLRLGGRARRPGAGGGTAAGDDGRAAGL